MNDTENFSGFLIKRGDNEKLKVIKKALKKLYRFNCPDCGTRLEANPNELSDVGNKISKFYCPICNADRFIGWGDLRKRIVYEDNIKK